MIAKLFVANFLFLKKYRSTGSCEIVSERSCAPPTPLSHGDVLGVKF